LFGSLLAPHRTLIRWSWFVGVCLIRTGMVTKLAEVKQERNTALLKVIEKDGTIGRLSEQLQSECQALVPSSPLLRAHHDFSSLFIF
jgi:TorA maturation chaperone TorD